MEMTDELATEIARETTNAAENYLNQLNEFLTSKELDDNKIGEIMMRAIEMMYGLFLAHCLESEDDVLTVLSGLEERVLFYAREMMTQIKALGAA